MALENISTPRLMADLHGVASKIELPRGQRHIATCNLPVRSVFSEPLPLAVQYQGESDAVQHAHYQRITYQKYQEEKERQLAEFQHKVRDRLKALKVREAEDKVNRTLLLQESENLMMKSVDPVRRPPLVTSPLVAINSLQVENQKTAKRSETELLVKSNKYARCKLVGEKVEVVTIPCTADDDSEGESETERESNDKENVKMAPRNVATHPDYDTIRIHRLKESRKAYSILERERMRETAREVEHKAAVQRLRGQTERDRALAEQLVNQAISKCKAESPVKQVPLEERTHKTVQRSKKITSQSERVIKRLRCKIVTMSTRPPSLCPCDTDILQTGPGLCAINCTFSHNSRAFAQALSSLLACYQ